MDSFIEWKGALQLSIFWAPELYYQISKELNDIQFHGAESKFASMQLFFTPLSQSLRLVMHLGEPLPEAILQNVEFNAWTLLLFFFLPFLMMMWTNGVGASTGMFVPALAVGATGRFFPGCLKLDSRP